MLLGIEIGGTKLQLGVGDDNGGELAALERLDVDISRGATGILEQIERTTASLLQRFEIERIGVGFGGPVDTSTGRVIKSHQVDGWDDIALADWLQRITGLPSIIGNEC